MSLSARSALDIAAEVSRDPTAARTITQTALDTARADTHNAFVHLFDDAAIREAASLSSRHSLALAGVPVAIKDNIVLGPDSFAQGDARGYAGPTTCASRILENYRSPFTATAAQKLIDAGAIVIGKTNLDEFAMGSSTEHSIFGPTRNPHAPTRVAGGSSGGSGAAVAAGIVPVALGSDTGGSVRQPAAWCGVIGVKPTYGRVSRYGLVAYASSLDQIGVFARTIPDAAAVLEIISGPDPKDSTSANRPVPNWSATCTTPPHKAVIGVPTQAMSAANHPECARLFDAALDTFRHLGYEVRTIAMPMLDEAVAAYYVVALAEASSNLARFDGVRYGRRAELRPGEGLLELYTRSRGEGFGEEVKRRIMLGTHLLSAGYADKYYVTALKARRLLADEFSKAFASGCTAIVCPTTPGPAFGIGERVDDPLAMYLEDVYTVGVNLAGLPAASIPMGSARVSDERLPMGLQIITPAFTEEVMFQIGHAFLGAHKPK